LATELNPSGLPGVRFVPIRFTPNASKFADEVCGGVNTIVVDQKHFRPLETDLEIALQLRRLYPDTWNVDAYARLLKNARTLDGVLTLQSRREIEAGYQVELRKFLDRRARFLIYP